MEVHYWKKIDCNIWNRDFRNKQNTNDAEKTVDNEVIKEQMVHRTESSQVSNIDVKRIPYDID